MDANAKHTLIERYLSGQLRGEELLGFEQMLLNDLEWRREVEFHRDLGAFLADKKAHELREVLKETIGTRKHGVRRSLTQRMLPLAATMAFLVVAAILLFRKDNVPNSGELFARNFEPYEMVLNARAYSDNPDVTVLNSAINAYEGQKYLSAIRLFKKLETVDSLGVIPVFYQGICHLALKHPKRAIAALDKVKKSNNALFAQQTNWYLGLAYLQAGDRGKALDVFKSISRSGGYKTDAAKKILEALD